LNGRGEPADTSPPHRFTVAAAEAGERLDLYLARRLDQSRSRVQHWIRDGRVAVDGEPARRPARAISPGETVECRPEPPPKEGILEPQSGLLRVLWEDEHLIVLDKTPDVAVHPGAGRGDRTLVNYLLERYPEIVAVGHPRRPGIVHRLDLGTSGVLAIARTQDAYLRLTTAFARREARKLYLAMVYGRPDPAAGEIDAGIARDPRDRKRMVAILPRRPASARAAVPSTRARAVVGSTRGRPALTLYRTLASDGGLSLLELDLRTGRTHQIRVHLKSRGLPIVGDPVYGEARFKSFPAELRAMLGNFPRPALHAWRLTLPHPATGQRVSFEAPLPPDLRELWLGVTGRPFPPLDRGATRGRS
jgi:23S rRNA pseudouridine1911/1915/1917 synthase